MVVVVVPLPLPELEVQEAWTLATGPVPGGTRLAGGVPGGALTVKVSVCPVVSVTVTLHTSAEAEGSPARAKPASAEPAATARIFSFRLMDTVVQILPRGRLSRPAT